MDKNNGDHQARCGKPWASLARLNDHAPVVAKLACKAAKPNGPVNFFQFFSWACSWSQAVVVLFADWYRELADSQSAKLWSLLTEHLSFRFCNDHWKNSRGPVHVEGSVLYWVFFFYLSEELLSCLQTDSRIQFAVFKSVYLLAKRSWTDIIRVLNVIFEGLGYPRHQQKSVYGSSITSSLPPTNTDAT